MPVISFASTKGGVGRTTSAIALATELVPRHRVVLIDADPARSVMNWAGKMDLVPHLQVQPSDGESSIQDEIKYARSQAEFVILDLDNQNSRLNNLVMWESDLTIVPTGDEQQEAECAIETLAASRRLARDRQRDLLTRILFTRTGAEKSELEKFLNTQMRERLNCFETELTRMPAFSALHSYGGPLAGLGLGHSRIPDRAKASVKAGSFADEVKEATKGLPRTRLQESAMST